MKPKRHYLFDWGDTLMADIPDFTGPMCDWKEVRAIPNAEIALGALSRISVCHLATNAKDSAPGQIRAALARVDLNRYIANVYCYCKVGFLKPSPRFFKYILDDLGVGRSTLVVVGDNLKNDVIGAAKCGIKSIWYNPGDLPIPNGVRGIKSLLDLLPDPGAHAAAMKLHPGDT